MTTERKDQPSGVTTEEIPKAPDEHVVTSDVAAEAPAANPPAASPTHGADDQTSQPDAEKPKQRRRDRASERRFGRLKTQLAKSDQRNTANETRIAELETQVNSIAAGDTPAGRGEKPKLEDYPKDPEAYAKAYGSWASKAPTAKPTEKPKPPATPASDTPAPRVPEKPFEDKEILDFNAQGKEKFGDEFVEALNDKDTAVNQQMGEFMIDSEYGTDIYLHLSNNHDEARKIFDHGPDRATKALKELETKAEKGELDIPEGQLKVEDPPDTGEPDAGKPTDKAAGGKRPGKTKAPEPPSDTKPGDVTPVKSPEDEDMDEYAARRGREERKRQGLPPL